VLERNVKNKTDKIKNDEVFSKGERRKVTLKIYKKTHSWIGHRVRHNECVVNILEGVISGKRAAERPRIQYLIYNKS